MKRAAPDPLADLPYLTSDLPGTGGVVKYYDEDFIVEEIPLYQASGEGTHVYFTIEKRGLTTSAAIRTIAKALGQNPNDIGYAGMKDAHGITRQRLSVEHVDPDTVRSLSLDRIQVLDVTRHGNKIKLGHLAGNRFEIKLRDVGSNAPGVVGAVLQRLQKRGMPNYFGPQRFGARGDNALVGRAVLRGDYKEAIAQILGRPYDSDRKDIQQARELFDRGRLEESAQAWGRIFADPARIGLAYFRSGGNAKEAWRSVDRAMRRLYVSAIQSELFNYIVAGRIDRLDRLETGDIAWKHRNGACFLVLDAEKEQPRCDVFEISPSGPLFGRKMRKPQGEPARREAEVLAASHLSEEDFTDIESVKIDGERRPLRVPLSDVTVGEGGDKRGAYVRLAFTLPPGAYATCVTREVCKVL
jgi:tRNA pseudouridine13 synthase